MKTISIFFLILAAMMAPVWSADDPQAKRESGAITVVVGGAVKKYGKYELKKGALVSEAIEKAGGVTEIASIHKVKVTRKLEGGELRVYALNLRAKGRAPDDMVLQDGDIVFVPEPIG